MSDFEIITPEADSRQISRPPSAPPKIDHIGIETIGLNNSIGWYRAFFGATVTWSLDKFSDVTNSRLPGITSLTELKCGSLGFHLFEQSSPLSANEIQKPRFQHICLRVDSSEALHDWRTHWYSVRDSRRFVYSLDDDPTQIAVDEDLIESFYLLDVNGLEYEFMYKPGRNG